MDHVFERTVSTIILVWYQIYAEYIHPTGIFLLFLTLPCFYVRLLKCFKKSYILPAVVPRLTENLAAKGRGLLLPERSLLVV